MEFNNDWFYDVSRFCNDVWHLYNICNWDKSDNKSLKMHLEDIIKGEVVYSSNEIANEYILMKACVIIDLINHGDKGYNIHSYIISMRSEWGDIVYCYNWVKFERGK